MQHLYVNETTTLHLLRRGICLLEIFVQLRGGLTQIQIHFLSKSSAGQVSLMIHLPGQTLSCPHMICRAVVSLNCNYAADYAIF